MPCFDPRDDDPAGVAVEEAREEWNHNSPVAELLCYVMTVVTTMGAFLQDDIEDNPELSLWWDDHQSRDASKNREELEALEAELEANRLQQQGLQESQDQLIERIQKLRGG